VNKKSAKKIVEDICGNAKALLIRDDHVIPVAFPCKGGGVDGIIPLQPVFDVAQVAFEKVGPHLADIFLQNMWTGLRVTLKENASDGIVVVMEGRAKKAPIEEPPPTLRAVSEDGRNVMTVCWKFRLDGGKRMLGSRLQFFKRSAGGEVMLEEVEECDTEVEGPLKEMLE
jgi:hypothetical protein